MVVYLFDYISSNVVKEIKERWADKYKVFVCSDANNEYLLKVTMLADVIVTEEGCVEKLPSCALKKVAMVV